MEKHPMRTFFLSAAAALSFSAPVFAEPVENSAICIIWDNTGKQVFGEPCTYQEWVSPGVAGRTTQLAIRDARGNISKQFSFFMNDNDALMKRGKLMVKSPGTIYMLIGTTMKVPGIGRTVRPPFRLKRTNPKCTTKV
jgi:hypothetical protein